MKGLRKWMCSMHALELLVPIGVAILGVLLISPESGLLIFAVLVGSQEMAKTKRKLGKEEFTNPF